MFVGAREPRTHRDGGERPCPRDRLHLHGLRVVAREVPHKAFGALVGHNPEIKVVLRFIH